MHKISKTTARDAPFRWKHAVLQTLIGFVVEAGGVVILNRLYGLRFAELWAYFEALPLLPLFIISGIFIVFSFMARWMRGEEQRMKILTGCMLGLGAAGLSIALVGAINRGMIPLGSFELDTENIRCRERRVVIPQNLQNIILKVSGEQEPGFSLELERRSAGNEHIDRLKIDKLAGDEAIKPGRYYFLARGEFPVPGPFAAGEIIYLNIVNAASFGGQLKLELIGKKGRFNYAAVPPHKQE